jgi:hypothetical protein
MLFRSTPASLTIRKVTFYLIVLIVDICQLHVALVHLVVVDDLVDLVDPLIVHEHAVVTLGDHLLATHELVVLRFHPETHRFNTGTLVQKGI